MNNESKILQEYREQNEIKKAAEKRVKELKEAILQMTEGQYDNFVLEFESRNVKEYVVAARVDTLIKIAEIKKGVA